jgi:hypothetical protein
MSLFPSLGSSNVIATDMDTKNPKIPKWVHHKLEKDDIHIDVNSGLVTASISDDPIIIIGVWNNTSQTYDKVTSVTKLYVTQLKTMIINCEIEPLRAAWLTDFTLCCLDRDILVVKECLTRTSEVFKNILDSHSDNSIDVAFDSFAVFEVMKHIHIGPLEALPKISFYMSKGGISVMEQGIVRFCFQYQIEQLLTEIKAEIKNQISGVGSIVSPCVDFKSWLKFFHSFKNPDKTEPFKDEIDLLLEFIVKHNFTEEYNMWASLNSKDDKNDVMRDYSVVISLLCTKLKTESKNTQKHFYSNFPPPPKF